MMQGMLQLFQLSLRAAPGSLLQKLSLVVEYKWVADGQWLAAKSKKSLFVLCIPVWELFWYFLDRDCLLSHN